MNVRWSGRQTGATSALMSSRGAAIWIAGLMLMSFVYFLPRWNSYNEDARLDVVLSVVNHGVISINPYHLNTGDETHVGNNYYSNKAPGQSLLGVPVYTGFKLLTSIGPVRSLLNDFERNPAWNRALADAACEPPIPGDHCRFVTRPRLDFAVLQYVEAILTVALPSVLMLLLFFWFLGFLSHSLVNRTLITLGLGLGTIVLPYSQLFFSHVPATACDLTGFVLIYAISRSRDNHPRVPRWIAERPGFAAATAGFALGLSVVFEYPAIIVAAIIAAYALVSLPKHLTAKLIVGSLPALAVVMAYDAIAYHNPFTTGYGCDEVKWKGECTGFAGFIWPPAATTIRDMSVGEYRGLFFMSPFLALAFPGFFLWYRSRQNRAELFACLASAVFFFVAICMYWGSNGGQVAGPRYLMELMPFLTLPVILVLDHVRQVVGKVAIYGLFAIGFANTWIETIGGNAFARGPQRNPLFAYNIPQLAGGHLPMSLSSFFGLDGPGSLIPLVILAMLWTTTAILRERARRLKATEHISVDRRYLTMTGS